jgi:two-component system, NarL family, response regulator NreC
MTKSRNETPTTVLIADDHGVLRAGLRALFAGYPYLRVVGEAAEGNEALRLAQKLVPDLVLLDINIRELDGIAVTEALGRALPATRVLILTATRDVELLRGALRAGACGYIVKSASESELMSAIAAVLRGDLYLDPSVTEALLTAVMVLEPPSTETNGLTPLTNREIEVLRLLGNGYTNAQIARDLRISARTVENHRTNLIRKLGTHSRAEIVRLANEYRPVQTPKPKSIVQLLSLP